MRSRYHLAVPVWVLAAVSLGLSVLAMINSLPLARWAYADWVAVSAATRESLLYGGPWFAAWGAWVAGRYLGPRSLLCPPSAARSGPRVVRAQLTLLGVAAACGHLLGLLPVLTWTAIQARTGALNPLVLLGSIAVLLAFGALGYLIGCGLPRTASVLGAVVASFGVILMVDTWGPALAPLRLSTPAAGFYETAVVAGFRVAFFAVCALALSAASAQLVAERSVVFNTWALGGLLTLTAPLALGFVAKSTAPLAVQREANPVPVCSSAGPIDVCVHPAKVDLLAALDGMVDNVMATVDHRPAVPVAGLYDSSLDREQLPNNFVLLNIEASDQQWLDWAAGDLASQLAGQPACLHRGDAFGDDVAPLLDHMAVSEAFASWIARNAGFMAPQFDVRGSSPQTLRLEQLPTDQVQSLYHLSAAEIASCRLPSSAIP